MLSEDGFEKAPNYYCIEHLRDTKVMVAGSLCSSYSDFIESLKNYHVSSHNIQSILEHSC